MTNRIYIKELSERIDRKPATVRMWEREKYLPKSLTPKRDNNKWRYWTEAQVKGIIEWLEVTDRKPGKGLPFYKKKK